MKQFYTKYSVIKHMSIIWRTAMQDLCFAVNSLKHIKTVETSFKEG